MTARARVDWVWKAGDGETMTFAWPGTLGDETYSCQVRPAATLTADGAVAPLVTPTVDVEQESVTTIAATIAVTAAQCRAAATAGYVQVAYDFVQTPAVGEPVTLVEGFITFTGDVTK